MCIHTVPSEAPQNLNVAEVSTHSVSLAWAAPPLSSQNGAITGYTVWVSKDANSSGYYLRSKEPYTTVANLDDDTTYTFTVAANTIVGSGPFSVYVTTKTKNFGENIK